MPSSHVPTTNQCPGIANSVSQQVAGESGLGKTTFINTLFSTTIKNYADHKRRHQKQVDKTVEIEITKAELEEKFFKGMNTVKVAPATVDRYLLTALLRVQSA